MAERLQVDGETGLPVINNSRKERCVTNYYIVSGSWVDMILTVSGVCMYYY